MAIMLTGNWRIAMKKIALAFVGLGSLLIASTAIASPGVPSVTAGHSLVQKTYYRHWHGGWHRGWRRGWYGPRYGFYGGPVVGYGVGGCYRWRHVCANRWGWGGPGFGRCLWRHGC